MMNTEQRSERSSRDPVTGAQQLIEIADLRFSWPKSSQPVLDIERLSIPARESLFLIGPSGSGKSTLLSILSGIIKPQDGSVQVLGKDLAEMNSSGRDKFRADHIGYIFQQFNLIPYLSVIDNVTLPCRFSAQRTQKARTKSGSPSREAKRLLAHLGLSAEQFAGKPVVELSVGQQQRVAAARALIGEPELVIADEPTSSLDPDHRAAFIKTLFSECERNSSTLVFVSHDHTLQKYFDRTLSITELNGTAVSSMCGEVTS